jgi:putative ABC transport system permease protein
MTKDQLKENIGIAFDSIRTQKARSFLTLLGVVIGVASVIIVASIIEGLNNDVIGRIQMLGSKVFFIMRVQNTPFGRLPEEVRLRKYFTYDDAVAIRESCPKVEFATAFLNRSVFIGGHENEIRYRNQQVTNVILRGVDEYYSDTIPAFDAQQGRLISRYDQDHARFVVVLGQGIADSLFPHSDPVGRTVRLNGVAFEVIGIYGKDEGLFGGPGIDQFACIPYSTFHKLYPEIREHFMAISVRDTSQLHAAVDEVVPVLRRRRRVPAREENDFELAMPEFFAQMWAQTTGALFLLTFTISSIALLVGGIGVMNIMLVSVTQRTREIGIRKAVGARRQDIRLQFLIEAMALTGAGGVIGILVGTGLGWLVTTLYPAMPVEVSAVWVFLGFTSSVGIGLFFGYYPAKRASELDPIVALRYE